MPPDHREFIIDDDDDRDAYHKCNDYMIANSSELIAYDNGKPPSGTASAVSKARKARLEVFHIFDELHNYFTTAQTVKQSLQSFPYITRREGVIFEGNNRSFPVKFSQIEKIEHNKEFLCFF